VYWARGNTIEDLARLAGTTTRNIRVYRDRACCRHRCGSGGSTLYNDTHLTRLRLITSISNRGYNIAHVRRCSARWEEGKDFSAMCWAWKRRIVGYLDHREVQDHAVAEAQRLINDIKAFDRLSNCR